MRIVSSSDDATPADDPVEIVNLPKQDTGLEGVIAASTAVLGVELLVCWFPGLPASDASSIRMRISPLSEARNHGVPAVVADRMAPVLTAWVEANREPLLAFWYTGVSWTRQEVAVHIEGF